MSSPFSAVVRNEAMHYACPACDRLIWRQGAEHAARQHLDTHHPGSTVDVDPTAGEVIYEMRRPVWSR